MFRMVQDKAVLTNCTLVSGSSQDPNENRRTLCAPPVFVSSAEVNCYVPEVRLKYQLCPKDYFRGVFSRETASHNPVPTIGIKLIMISHLGKLPGAVS